jgi:hypothetical protein
MMMPDDALGDLPKLPLRALPRDTQRRRNGPIRPSTKDRSLPLASLGQPPQLGVG